MHVRGSGARVLEERRLADTGLPSHDQRAASGRSGGVKERADPILLSVAPVEHLPILRLSSSHLTQPPDPVRRVVSVG